MKTFEDRKPILGQDPHVTNYQGKYILCESQNEERISLSILTSDGRKDTRVVWDDPQEHQVWGPELHHINGMWFIYYSSSKGENKTHRTKVLGPAMYWHGPYQNSQTMGPDFWGIDMTVFHWQWNYYAIWSGWNEDTKNEFPQHLYIAPLINPREIGERILLDSPCFPWEKGIAPILEGPQAFVEDRKLYLLYSANASWSHEYATGILELNGENPLNPKHWIKCPWPLRMNAGHGHILEDSFIHHRKMSTMPGWNDREIVRISKERFLEDGRFKAFKGEV